MMEKGCIICGGSLHHLINIDNMPASAQNIPCEDELGLDKPITLELCQCDQCGLVQLNTKPVDYYKDVIRAGGGTTTMQHLRQEEYRRLLHVMKEKKILGRNIVEVGCGRGEFLKMWEGIEEDITVHGIEHKKELVEAAKGNGLDVEQAFAEEGVIFSNAPYDAFVQFNFLEHQPKPLEMLKCIYDNVKEGAMGLVTVPSLEYIMKYDGYYELIRDHIANYDERTLKEIFERANFRVLNERIVNRDTIEIIVEKVKDAGFEKSAFDGVYINVQPLLENYSRIRNDFEAYIKELESKHQTIAIWGAGHQGFTLAATTEMLGKVKYIIDSAKFKQGRFAPASHVPIVAPDYFFLDPVDEILIVAPGYTDEIAETIHKKFGNEIRIRVLKSDRITEYTK